ncbi:hypothetical protein LWI28_015264 [Acer negundo]|uniref:Uncharacterized protein n=1 Tax=Acer negundo TaxID=4023 RepID=A0AAD5IAE8_ACENE|nr:hypothetical protein LWI28_015264 [Acer negundo]
MERIESWNSEGGQQEAEKVVVHDNFKDLRGLMDGDEILNESDLIQIPIELAKGISINTVDLTNTMYPLIYGGDAPNVTGGFSNISSRFCMEDSLDRNLVKGKIVLCDRLDTGEWPFYAGAVGTVIQDTVKRDFANNFPLPTSYVNKADGRKILTYIKSNSNASATIFKSMQGKDTLAPYVASFSSRGPNLITPGILKVINFT